MTVVLPIADRPDRGLPIHVSVHMSGGRDLWTVGNEQIPADPGAATWAALNQVLDPEIPISLVELGLIYQAEFEAGVTTVHLTFTATACPCMEFIREDIVDRLEMEPWIERVELVEVWDPPWTNARVTPEGRAKLRQLGVGI